MQIKDLLLLVCMSDARYMMELGNQLITLFVEAGICLADFIDIEADDRLL